MAALLKEMNNAAHDARDRGDDALAAKLLETFLVRYDTIVENGLTANPQPPHRGRDYLERKSFNLVAALDTLKPEATRFAAPIVRVPMTNNLAERDLSNCRGPREDQLVLPERGRRAQLRRHPLLSLDGTQARSESTPRTRHGLSRRRLDAADAHLSNSQRRVAPRRHDCQCISGSRRATTPDEATGNRHRSLRTVRSALRNPKSGGGLNVSPSVSTQRKPEGPGAAGSRTTRRTRRDGRRADGRRAGQAGREDKENGRTTARPTRPGQAAGEAEERRGGDGGGGTPSPGGGPGVVGMAPRGKARQRPKRTSTAPSPSP